MSTVIKFCPNCKANNITHDFQDKTYGKFNRVFNISEKTGSEVCTVCNGGKKKK